MHSCRDMGIPTVASSFCFFPVNAEVLEAEGEDKASVVEV